MTLLVTSQCLTLAPVVHLKASIASQEDKEWLSGALFHLRQPSTGSLDGDVHKLGDLIDQYATASPNFLRPLALADPLLL